MPELFERIEEFPDYQVSTYGQVISDHSGVPLKRRLLAYGAPAVWMVKDREQYCRAVPLLVARTWLPEPQREDFITPIQLNGDRQNCYADNLMWRPRWFAIDYHKEKLQNRFPNWRALIQLIETKEIFDSPRHCSLRYGMLERDIHHSIINKTAVFPDWFHFRYAA